MYDDGLTLLTEIFSEKIFRDLQGILSSGFSLSPIFLGPPTLTEAPGRRPRRQGRPEEEGCESPGRGKGGSPSPGDGMPLHYYSVVPLYRWGH